jgi:hypothetical protein
VLLVKTYRECDQTAGLYTTQDDEAVLLRSRGYFITTPEVLPQMMQSKRPSRGGWVFLYGVRVESYLAASKRKAAAWKSPLSSTSTPCDIQ